MFVSLNSLTKHVFSIRKKQLISSSVSWTSMCDASYPILSSLPSKSSGCFLHPPRCHCFIFSSLRPSQLLSFHLPPVGRCFKGHKRTVLKAPDAGSIKICCSQSPRQGRKTRGQVPPLAPYATNMAWSDVVLPQAISPGGNLSDWLSLNIRPLWVRPNCLSYYGLVTQADLRCNWS